MPAINSIVIINSPSRASNESQQPMRRYRHIADIAIEISGTTRFRLRSYCRWHNRSEFDEGLYPHCECCIASGNLATIPNYLTAELRYRDAGETRLKSAKS
jgi:hypothetical protein